MNLSYPGVSFNEVGRLVSGDFLIVPRRFFLPSDGLAFGNLVALLRICREFAGSLRLVRAYLLLFIFNEESFNEICL
jgi:hypothetical protein